MRDCCADTPEAAPTPMKTTGVGFSLPEAVIALAGNPNAGKSTIFNALTGAHQHVGNWPGKTVERKEGRLRLSDCEVSLIDLPGTYSLSAYSAEEVVAMDFLLGGEPDGVVVVVDASNLERNLYLAVQIIEMGLPVVVALNMMDTARSRGLHIDVERLSQGLGGTPVIPTVARSEQGMTELMAAIEGLLDTATGPARDSCQSPGIVDYGPDIDREVEPLATLIDAQPALQGAFDPAWLAVKLLEDNPAARGRVANADPSKEISTAAQAAAGRIESVLGEACDILIPDHRYGFINGLVRVVVQRPPLDRRTRTDRLDQIVTHPVFGLIIFVAAMWVVFQLTANVSSYYVDWIDGVINGPISRWATALLGIIGLGSTWIESLIVDGIIAGVGGVLVFVPVLALMYFLIALLEDSGYMARAAFLMDRFMHLVGLHGKSFIPMLLGFGCSVPGIYAARTLDDEKDRLLTALLVPFMSCGARLPVYLVIGVAFFGVRAGTLAFALYVLGIIVALAVGLLLKGTVFRTKQEAPFVIELPPYRAPSLKGLLIHTWERTRGFVENATTVILAASVIVWLLVSTPVNASTNASFAAVDTEHSALAMLSGWMSPIFRPAGYGNWQAASSLVTGFVAKEVIVSTLSVVYVGGEDIPTAENTSLGADLAEIGQSFLQATWDTVRATVSLVPGINLMRAESSAIDEAGTDAALITALRNAFTPLAAVAFCVFVLLTAPCVTTMAAMRHEFGSRWMAFSVGMMLIIAWVASVLVYQGGHLLGFA